MVPLEGTIDPASYILGPGDELGIVVWGDLEQTFDVIVNPDGAVIIPTVGSVTVAGKSLADATDLIIDMVREPYRAKKVTVSLMRVRTFLVAVAGAVKSPGTVEVHAGQRVDGAIQKANGFLFGPKSTHDTTSVLMAAPRLITIRHADGDIVSADLVLFMRTGDKDADPYLRDGDMIEVPLATTLGSQIGVFGAFRAPGVYDYLPSDRLSTAMRLAGGLSSACDVNRATLARFSSDDSTWTEIPVDLEGAMNEPGGQSDEALLPGDRLFVPWKSNWRELNQVDVVGQIRYPGTYPIVLGRTTLSEVIATAGGLLPDADLDQSKVIRTLPEREWDPELERLIMSAGQQLDPMEKEYRKFSLRLDQDLAVVDFNALFVDHDIRQDILLAGGDVIRIPKRIPSVQVFGQVLYPGYVHWAPGLSYHDYISRAGGYAARADRGRVRLISGQSDSWTKPEGGTEVRPGDTIFVPEKTLHEKETSWKYFIETVAVLTQVATLVLVIQNINK
jgi:polysaccharide export outer membrane protein